MRHMRIHEALWAYGGTNLFCSPIGITKQIFTRGFGRFCLILPHIPHVFGFVRQMMVKNMRLMREHEDRVFKGICLFRIGMGVRVPPSTRKHEANMRMQEGDPHVFPHIFARRAA